MRSDLTPDALADVVELIIRQAIRPLVIRLRALEAKGGAPSVPDRPRIALARAAATLQQHLDQRRVDFLNVLRADGFDAP